MVAGHCVGAALWGGSRPIYSPLVNDVVVLELAVAVFQSTLYFVRKKKKQMKKKGVSVKCFSPALYPI